MGKEFIMFGNIKDENTNFTNTKAQILINDEDTSKIIVSNSAPFGKKSVKYSIGYENGKKVRPLCIMLPKKCPYRRDFEEIKYVVF